MTETGEQQVTSAPVAEAKASAGVKLRGLFLKKVGMTSVYGSAGEMIPVTVLKMEPTFISQLKTDEKDGYKAVQVASGAKRATRTSKAERGHLSKAGFENGAYIVREIRQDSLDGLTVGAAVSLDSVAKGDVVRVTATSKGKGFAGSVKRHNFAGGPAAHGSKFHRQPGSSGNRTWPGRVMPGKRFPGHLGDETTTIRNVQVVDVIPEESVILVKGPVPGARHSLVKMVKE